MEKLLHSSVSASTFQLLFLYILCQCLIIWMIALLKWVRVCMCICILTIPSEEKGQTYRVFMSTFPFREEIYGDEPATLPLSYIPTCMNVSIESVHTPLCLSLTLLFSVLGVNARPSCNLNKCSTTELLNSNPPHTFLISLGKIWHWYDLLI